MTREEILELAGDSEVPIAILEGMDSACLGIARTTEHPHLVYSRAKCIEALQGSGMSQDEAVEWLDYNTYRSLHYMGEGHPIIIEP